MRKLLLLGLGLFLLGARDVNDVGGTRMKIVGVPLTTTVYVTSSDLSGWSEVTKVGYKSGIGSPASDSLYVHLATGWTGFSIGASESRLFPLRPLSMTLVARASTKPDTLFALKSGANVAWPSFLYLWGD